MTTGQNDQQPAPRHSEDLAVTNSAAGLLKMAKPLGAFAGSKDLILRFRNGELVVANTGDQGGGQN